MEKRCAPNVLRKPKHIAGKRNLLGHVLLVKQDLVMDLFIVTIAWLSAELMNASANPLEEPTASALIVLVNFLFQEYVFVVIVGGNRNHLV
jgi:hypothetical protein